MIDLAEVNHVLEAFPDDARFERRKGRLWFVNKYGEAAAVSSNTGWYPAFKYGRLNMGGTRASAVMQLAHWARDRNRVPLWQWEYWVGPKVKLAGPELLRRLEASSYPDPAKTCCVLCGSPNVGDWYSYEGLVGPCCWGGPKCGILASR